MKGTDEAWESGQLGQDIEHAVRAPRELEKQVDDAMGMQAISIRLEKDLIESFKLIAIDMNRAKRELSKKKVLKIVESKSPRSLPPLKHSVESAVVGVSLSRNQIKQITDSSSSIVTKKRRYHQIP